MRNHSYIIAILALLGCTKIIDFPYPKASQSVALNGFLYPDSTVRVDITWTVPLKRKEDIFPPVENAVVSLYEDGDLFDELIHTTNGQYVLDYQPQAGKTYKIEAVVPEYGLVTASDVMPKPPAVTACFMEDESLTFSGVMIHVGIDDNLQENNYYWLNFVQRLYNEEKWDWDADELVFYPNSNTVFLDRFNATFDNRGSQMYEFHDYLRFDDLGHEGKPIEVEATASDPTFRLQNLEELQNVLYVNFFSASYHYDRYLKSSIIHFLNNDFLDINPFAEPVKIYSNVENGTGIFAACNNVQLLINQNECE